MTVPRACNNCRASKVRCDGDLPFCGRCVRRGLTSCDVSTQRQFLFRDETIIAQKLSERARGQPSSTASAPLAAPVTSESSAESSKSPPGAFDTPDLQRQYPWLNEHAIAEIPEPLKRDIETRAIERFFVDWTVHPSKVSPGHMHHLPMLYESAPAESVLPLVVQAVAFADRRNARDSKNETFAVKAQRSYVAALARMRAIADNGENFADDRVLAALLLFDCYETVYLAKSDLLGTHSDAIQYVIYARGMDQLYHHPRFCLWRVANWQLQARQVLRGEEPSAIQQQLASKLNIDRPELHISADVLQISTLCAAAKRLLSDSANGMARQTAENLDCAAYILQSMSSLLGSIDAWTSVVTGPWKPNAFNTRENSELAEERHFASSLHYYCPLTFIYSDSSLACIWNFHFACQIVLREWAIRLTLFSSQLLDQEEATQVELDRINEQKEAIARLSGSVIRSVPPLMGFADAYSSAQAPALSYEGTMVAR